MRGWAKNTVAFVVTVAAMVTAYWFFVLIPMQNERAEAADTPLAASQD